MKKIMKTGKRILIITDSVSMPRKEIPYEETWIYYLKVQFPGYDFIDRSSRGTTSTRLVTEGGGGIDLLETYNPDTVILQLGITECAPRLFKKPGLEYFIVSRVLPNEIKNRYIKFIKKHRVRNPEITDVRPDVFRKNLENYFARAMKKNIRIIVILILPPSGELLKKSPFAGQNIDKYNEIFKELSMLYPNVELLYPLRDVDNIDNYMIDEVHLDSTGYRILSEQLREIL